MEDFSTNVAISGHCFTFRQETKTEILYDCSFGVVKFYKERNKPPRLYEHVLDDNEEAIIGAIREMDRRIKTYLLKVECVPKKYRTRHVVYVCADIKYFTKDLMMLGSRESRRFMLPLYREQGDEEEPVATFQYNGDSWEYECCGRRVTSEDHTVLGNVLDELNNYCHTNGVINV